VKIMKNAEPKTAPLPTPGEPMMALLSQLLLLPRDAAETTAAAAVREMDRERFDALVALASSNHVIIRGMGLTLEALRDPQDALQAKRVASVLADERERITAAVDFLSVLCAAFEESRLDVTVIKSLDHWPDLGSDIDLYTNASPEAVCAMMRRRFSARLAPRSWGDRLACKWNFLIPGLPEPVEVHVGRLGQTGEQVRFASRVPGRARVVNIDGRPFRVAHPSDRIMISTLQRMYRHFYFRLCDIVDSAQLVDSGILDFEDLRATAQSAGIWEGVATYLVIVSDYVRQYRGTAPDLPSFVAQAARFGGDLIYFGKDFLRVPILPQSAALYRRQLTEMLRRCELHSSARLGLFPWLATAAAVGMKITGSDKGIW
jgi:uncharacterized protein